MYTKMELYNFLFISGGLYEKHVVAPWNLGTFTANAYSHRETKKKSCRGGRSQEILNTDIQSAVQYLK